MNCSKCGSYAINHHLHGRDGSNPDLCDVCYWRGRAGVDAETAKDAACWRMLPAFFADYQIESMKLYRDMDALLAAQAPAKGEHDHG